MPIQNTNIPTTSTMSASRVRNLEMLYKDIQNTRKTQLTSKSPALKSAGIPKRKAPNVSDHALVKEGLKNISQSKIMFSVQLLVALLLKVAEEQRKAGRIAHMEEATVAEKQGEAAAADIRQEGVMDVVGSVASSTAQIAGASIVIGGGVRMAKSSNFMEVSNKMMSYQAVSQTMGSVGKMGEGGSQYEAKQDEAEQAIHNAAAGQAKSLEESDDSDQKEEGEVIQSIIQLEDKLEETRHEAMRAATTA